MKKTYTTATPDEQDAMIASSRFLLVQDAWRNLIGCFYVTVVPWIIIAAVVVAAWVLWKE